MAVWIIHLILVLSIANIPVGQSDIIEQAETAYMAGDYAQSIALYEMVVINNVQNASLFFNLGNAYYQSGQLGKALLNFQRAYRLAPRDIDTQNNISMIRAERADYQKGESSIIETIANSSTDFFSIDELLIIALTMWYVWFGIIILLWLSFDFQKILRSTAIGLGIIVLGTLILLGSRYYVDQYRPLAVITVPVAQIMSGPGIDYLPLYQLFDAAEIRIIEIRNEWARFILPNGNQGWISQNQFENI